MAPTKDSALSTKDKERAEQMRAAFAVWTTPKGKTVTKPEEPKTPQTPTKVIDSTTPKEQTPKQPQFLANPEQPATPRFPTKVIESTTPKEPTPKLPLNLTISKGDDVQESVLDNTDNNSGVAIEGDFPAYSSDISPCTQEKNKIIPLTAGNLIGNADEEEERRITRAVERYNLNESEKREFIEARRIKNWLIHTYPEDDGEEIDSDEILSVIRQEKEGDQDQTDGESSDSGIIKRLERVTATKERLSALICRNKIQTQVPLFLRHAMHTDAEYIAGVVNSYVRCSAHTLESESVTGLDIIQRIDNSRNQELPFVVAMKQLKERGSRWGKIVGFVRLTNFLQGQPSVAGTAQLEIMVAHDSKGEAVGRCLMDALLTIADPSYSSRGGYSFDTSTPNDTIMTSASWSCRPLTKVVAMMSHTREEKSRCQVVEEWLENEHEFIQQGYLQQVARKLGQHVNISLLVRNIPDPLFPENVDIEFEW